MSAYLLIAIVSVLTCAGQLCQKQAAQYWQMGHADRLNLTGRWLASALVLLALGLLVWLIVLQRLPVGIAYPMLSINFVLVTLCGRFFFNEPIGSRHWAGVILIMVGVILMSLSK